MPSALELAVGTREKLGRLPVAWWHVWRLGEKLGAGPKHPVDLGQRRGAVKPVKGLTDRHGVGEPVAQWDRLSRPFERLDLTTDRLTHCRERLDCDDPRAGRDKRASELAGAGSEIENSRTVW